MGCAPVVAVGVGLVISSATASIGRASASGFTRGMPVLSACVGA